MCLEPRHANRRCTEQGKQTTGCLCAAEAAVIMWGWAVGGAVRLSAGFYYCSVGHCLSVCVRLHLSCSSPFLGFSLTPSLYRSIELYLQKLPKHITHPIKNGSRSREDVLAVTVRQYFDSWAAGAPGVLCSLNAKSLIHHPVIDGVEVTYSEVITRWNEFGSEQRCYWSLSLFIFHTSSPRASLVTPPLALSRFNFLTSIQSKLPSLGGRRSAGALTDLETGGSESQMMLLCEEIVNFCKQQKVNCIREQLASN